MYTKLHLISSSAYTIGKYKRETTNKGTKTRSPSVYLVDSQPDKNYTTSGNPMNIEQISAENPLDGIWVLPSQFLLLFAFED